MVWRLEGVVVGYSLGRMIVEELEVGNRVLFLEILGEGVEGRGKICVWKLN